MTKPHRTALRYGALVLMLTLTLPLLAGCFIQPDRTLDPQADPQNTVQPLPFSTPAPLPTTAAPTSAPTPNPQGEAGNTAWQQWGNISGEATATPRPASSWQTSTEDYNAGYPVLKVGSSGSDVSDMQERLKELGYFTDTVDGRFASSTQDAVMAFQTTHGLTADGVAGRATQDKLYSSSAIPKQSGTGSTSGSSGGKTSSSGGSSGGSGGKTSSSSSVSSSSNLLKSGSQGTTVRKLQVRLAELGYYNGGADGYFGPNTQSAVKAFQRNNGLSADGQAGKQTQDKLYGSNAKPAASPVKTADPNAVRALQMGMEGNDVYSLQKRLIELKYLNGVADAVFGIETQAAVLAFQRNNGLTADGVAGAGTQSKLSSKSAKPAVQVSATATPKPGNYVLLQEGDSGQYVYDVQERLYDLCYYTGRIDGRFGAGTTAAVRAFQRANGLSADGVAGAATQKKLFSSSAQINPAITGYNNGGSRTPEPLTTPSVALLQEGNQGDGVRLMQIYLEELGYYSGRADGYFGPATTTAVRAFQRANNLTADGVAGTSTLTLLYSGYAVPMPADTATAAPDLGSALFSGSTGERVKQLQARLFQLYYIELDGVTSTYDAATEQAVMAFQLRNGLDVDGVAGPGTLSKLYSTAAVSNILDD